VVITARIAYDVRTTMSAPPVRPILDAARTHVRDAVLPSLDTWHRSSAFPRDAFRAAGELGLCGYYVPRERGGRQLQCADVAPMFEIFGQVDTAYGLAISIHNFAALAASSAAPETSAGRWTEELASGRALGGILVTEPSGGSDPAGAMETRVRPDGDGFRLTGKKAWVTFAGEADVYAVVCRSGEATRGTKDMMMVLVQADDPGVQVTRVYGKATGSFLPIGEITFQDVFLDAGRVLGPAGHGFGMAMSTIDIARVHVAAAAVGLAAAALDAAIAETKQRRIFGSPVLELQANLFALADVETSIHAGRLLYQHAAQVLGTPQGSLAAAHAKRYTTDAAIEATMTCSRVMGANGTLVDRPLPGLVAGAQWLAMADGSQNVQRLLIGRELVRRAEVR
jgi:alkylation response protein AidB-like acyl-CoA dehydrogenase